MDSSFPYPLQIVPHQELRENQAKFLSFIERNPKAMIQAPNGFGKTLLSLISAIPFVKQNGFQLYIFVRTKTQVFQVFLKQIINLITNREYEHLTVVPLIMKGDLCLKEKTIPYYAKGICKKIECTYLEQVLAISEDYLISVFKSIVFNAYQKDIDSESFKNAFKGIGCPYYIIKRCIPYADIIVTTHTYLKGKTLQNIMSELLKQNKSNKIAIIDEAHNFSAFIESELTLKEIQKARNIIPNKILDTLEEMIKNFDGRVDRPNIISKASQKRFLYFERNVSFTKKINLARVYDFISSSGDIWVSESDRILQINPFPDYIFNFVNNYFNRVILTSGTFFPINSYKKLYSINYPSLQIPSSFQFSLNGIFSHKFITSKYSQRQTKTYELIASIIQRLHGSNPYHTVVFTSSHDLKQKILDNISLRNIYVEYKGINPSFMDEIIEKKHVCIFGVIGGKLSEGIEILSPETNRSMLTLIIIVGIPFSKPTVSNQLLSSLYMQRWGRKIAKHLDILSVTRGITQAIGRGIRSESDFAASLILDYRACAIGIRSILPKTLVFHNIQTMFNSYDIFFSRMNRIFNSK